MCTPHARPFKLKAVCRCTFDWQRNDFLKTPVLFCLIFEHGKYSYARDDFLLFQACSQGSESSFRTSLAKFHVSILGQFFLFYKHIAYLKNPADRPMTFMSWFYSDQSTPTYYSFTILSLSVLATFYENRASELTCCGNTTFPNIT